MGPRTALVTGGTGLAGGELVRALVADGVRVLATARSLQGVQRLRSAGAEPLHGDLAAIAARDGDLADVEVVFHLGLPRLDPPVRSRGLRRRVRLAAEAAAAVRQAVGERPCVLASSGLVYGDRADSAADEGAAASPVGPGRMHAAAEEALAGPGLRVVRLPWVYGPGGLARDLIVGLRTRRFRVVGAGENRWGLLSAADAASALRAAAALPPGLYNAVEESPRQIEVIAHLCATVGDLRRPDHAPAALAAIPYGGPLVAGLAAGLWIDDGRLRRAGWSPGDDWRRGLSLLAQGALPLPGS